MVVACFIQALIALMLLLIEVKKRGTFCNAFLQVRTQIFFIIMILQVSKLPTLYLMIDVEIDTALHFIFYTGTFKIGSLILMESIRFYVFFLVCYYFLKKAANLLTVTNGVIPPPPGITADE